MHSKMSLRGAWRAMSFVFALTGLASATPDSNQAVQIGQSTLLDLIDAGLVDALGIDEQDRFVAFVGLPGGSGCSAFVAVIPRTVNGTDVDNDDDLSDHDTSGTGSTTPPVTPPITAPATQNPDSWWERVWRWIWC